MLNAMERERSMKQKINEEKAEEEKEIKDCLKVPVPKKQKYTGTKLNMPARKRQRKLEQNDFEILM